VGNPLIASGRRSLLAIAETFDLTNTAGATPQVTTPSSSFRFTTWSSPRFSGSSTDCLHAVTSCSGKPYHDDAMRTSPSLISRASMTSATDLCLNPFENCDMILNMSDGDNVGEMEYAGIQYTSVLNLCATACAGPPCLQLQPGRNCRGQTPYFPPCPTTSLPATATVLPRRSLAPLLQSLLVLADLH
jgi:hypothetical protein